MNSDIILNRSDIENYDFENSFKKIREKANDNHKIVVKFLKKVLVTYHTELRKTIDLSNEKFIESLMENYEETIDKILSENLVKNIYIAVEKDLNKIFEKYIFTPQEKKNFVDNIQAIFDKQKEDDEDNNSSDGITEITSVTVDYIKPPSELNNDDITLTMKGKEYSTKLVKYKNHTIKVVNKAVDKNHKLLNKTNTVNKKYLKSLTETSNSLLHSVKSNLKSLKVIKKLSKSNAKKTGLITANMSFKMILIKLIKWSWKWTKELIYNVVPLIIPMFPIKSFTWIFKTVSSIAWNVTKILGQASFSVIKFAGSMFAGVAKFIWDKVLPMMGNILNSLRPKNLKNTLKKVLKDPKTIFLLGLIAFRLIQKFIEYKTGNNDSKSFFDFLFSNKLTDKEYENTITGKLGFGILEFFFGSKEIATDIDNFFKATAILLFGKDPVAKRLKAHADKNKKKQEEADEKEGISFNAIYNASLNAANSVGTTAVDGMQSLVLNIKDKTKGFNNFITHLLEIFEDVESGIKRFLRLDKDDNLFSEKTLYALINVVDNTISKYINILKVLFEHVLFESVKNAGYQMVGWAVGKLLKRPNPYAKAVGAIAAVATVVIAGFASGEIQKMFKGIPKESNLNSSKELETAEVGEAILNEGASRVFIRKKNDFDDLMDVVNDILGIEPKPKQTQVTSADVKFNVTTDDEGTFTGFAKKTKINRDQKIAFEEAVKKLLSKEYENINETLISGDSDNIKNPNISFIPTMLDASKGTVNRLIHYFRVKSDNPTSYTNSYISATNLDNKDKQRFREIRYFLLKNLLERFINDEISIETFITMFNKSANPDFELYKKLKLVGKKKDGSFYVDGKGLMTYTESGVTENYEDAFKDKRTELRDFMIKADTAIPEMPGEDVSAVKTSLDSKVEEVQEQQKTFAEETKSIVRQAFVEAPKKVFSIFTNNTKKDAEEAEKAASAAADVVADQAVKEIDAIEVKKAEPHSPHYISVTPQENPAMADAK